MIAKSDIIILFISSSVLTLGLYNHYELQGPANPGNRTSLVASTIDNIQKSGEAFADNAAQAWQFTLTKINGDSSNQSSDNDVSPVDKAILPTASAPQKIQPSLTQTSQPEASSQVPALSQASASIPVNTLPVTQTGEADGFVKAAIGASEQQSVEPAEQTAATTSGTTLAGHYSAVTRIPGNATVLVISPSGSSRSDATGPTSPVNKSVTATTAAENSGSSTVLSQEETGSSVEIAAERKATESEQSTESRQVTEPRAEQPRIQQLIKIHQVQSGETLTGIAEALGTTVERLKEMNQLSDDRILAGQDLVYETSVFTSARLSTDIN